jgi:flagellar capping protein FliD
LSEASLKIQYIEKQLRLRLRFFTSLCLKSEEPPAVLFQKVRSQFEAEKIKGHLDFYEVTEKSFALLWYNIRTRLAENSDSSLEKMEIVFTAGCGSKIIPQLSLILKESAEGTKLIHIKATAGFNWTETGFDMLRLNFYRLARKQGIKISLNQSHLFSLWQDLKKKGSVENYIVEQEPDSTATPEGYYFAVNKQRKELAVVITDTHFFEKIDNVFRIHQAMKHKVQKLNSEPGANYQFLSDAITERLKAALRGPERWGMHFPLVYLVGIHSDEKLVEERTELRRIVGAIPQQSHLASERRKILESMNEGENTTAQVAQNAKPSVSKSVTAKKRLDDRIRGQDDEIVRKEERMSQRKAQLERTFASLDAKMATMKSDGQVLSARLGSKEASNQKPEVQG